VLTRNIDHKRPDAPGRHRRSLSERRRATGRHPV